VNVKYSNHLDQFKMFGYFNGNVNFAIHNICLIWKEINIARFILNILYNYTDNKIVEF